MKKIISFCIFLILICNMTIVSFAQNSNYIPQDARFYLDEKGNLENHHIFMKY